MEFRFHPNLTTTVDGFVSDFKDLQTKRGIELPLGFQALIYVQPGDLDRGARTASSPRAPSATSAVSCATTSAT
ncbi:hypothetical protein AB5I41_02580 [Sphingomonas sp. MMS24-JH45]